MRLNIRIAMVASLACFLFAGLVQGVAPNALENAYWRFENGTVGQPVDQGNDTVPDSINGNHLRTFFEPSAPVYTAEVPVSKIPQTGSVNAVALHFTPNQDIYADGKNINNPIVTAFTVEAAFKPESIGEGRYQGIVGKDGKPTAGPEQTFVIKVRGDSDLLQVEWFDKSGIRLSIESLAPLVANRWYYVAVVVDSSTGALYLDQNDGAGYLLQGSATVTDGPLWQGIDPVVGDDRAWVIGRGMFDNNVTDWFAGVIDEVRLTNQALTTEQFLFTRPVPPLPGDFDDNGHVDINDLTLFDRCMTGPAIPYDPQHLPEGCTLELDGQGYIPADFDQDRDVDQEDFGAFQAAFTG